MSSIDMALVLASGVITGVLGAILGTGGGVFLIPILVLGLHVPMHHAVATSIVSVIATSSAVASANVERGIANMRLGMTLEIATSTGAILGGLSAGWLSADVLQGVFGSVLIPTAVLMWVKSDSRTGGELVATGARTSQPTPAGRGRAAEIVQETEMLGAAYFDRSESRRIVYRVKRLPAGLAISSLAGALSGLLGIGGGIFKVPALHLVCDIPVKAAAATSNFMIGVTAAASAFIYYGRGEVRPILTGTSVLGVLFGSAIGGLVNRFIKAVYIRRVFAILLVVVAIQMLANAWSPMRGIAP